MSGPIGTCSECGGPVMLVESEIPEEPDRHLCKHCMRTGREDYGPVIPMANGEGIRSLRGRWPGRGER